MSGKKERDAQRYLLDELIRQANGYSKNGGCPGTPLYLSVEGGEAEVLMVSREELTAWLQDAKPGLGTITIAKTDGVERWSAQCDEHGEVASGEITAAGHDDTVRGWYVHSQDVHGGSGVIPHGDLIERRDGAR